MSADEITVLVEDEEEYVPDRVWETESGWLGMSFDKDREDGDLGGGEVLVKIPACRVEAVIHRYRDEEADGGEP